MRGAPWHNTHEYGSQIAELLAWIAPPGSLLLLLDYFFYDAAIYHILIMNGAMSIPLLCVGLCFFNDKLLTDKMSRSKIRRYTKCKFEDYKMHPATYFFVALVGGTVVKLAAAYAFSEW